MKDNYVHLFVRKPVRRAPIINRGMITLLLEIRTDIPSFFCPLVLIWFCCFCSCMYYLKVILLVGLLSASFFISFQVVKRIMTKEAPQRSKYCHWELVLIQPFFSCRCLGFVFCLPIYLYCLTTDKYIYLMCVVIKGIMASRFNFSTVTLCGRKKGKHHIYTWNWILRRCKFKQSKVSCGFPGSTLAWLILWYQGLRVQSSFCGCRVYHVEEAKYHTP